MLRDVGGSDLIVTAGIPAISCCLTRSPVTARSAIAGVPCAAGCCLIGGGAPSGRGRRWVSSAFEQEDSGRVKSGM